MKMEAGGEQWGDGVTAGGRVNRKMMHWCTEGGGSKCVVGVFLDGAKKKKLWRSEIQQREEKSAWSLATINNVSGGCLPHMLLIWRHKLHLINQNTREAAESLSSCSTAARLVSLYSPTLAQKKHRISRTQSLLLLKMVTVKQEDDCLIVTCVSCYVICTCVYFLMPVCLCVAVNFITVLVKTWCIVTGLTPCHLIKIVAPPSNTTIKAAFMIIYE